MNEKIKNKFNYDVTHHCYKCITSQSQCNVVLTTLHHQQIVAINFKMADQSQKSEIMEIIKINDTTPAGTDTLTHKKIKMFIPTINILPQEDKNDQHRMEILS